MFVVPPTNHCAWGGVQSRTLFQGVNQCRDFASSSQNLSGSFAADS